MPSEDAPTENSPQEEHRQQLQTPYLNIEEAAKRLKLSPNTLNKWRHLGIGPVFRDHGRRIVYHIDDLDSWSQRHKRQKARTYGSNKLIPSDAPRGEK